MNEQEEQTISAQTAGDSPGGLRLSRFNRILLVIAIILALISLFLSRQIYRSYGEMNRSTEIYIEARQDAADMQIGSDYLTDQVRMFVVTGTQESARNYFREAEETRRRDRAVESIQQLLAGSEAASHLQNALSVSNALMQIEHYAMRLAIEVRGESVSVYPKALQDVELSADDVKLSANLKYEQACNLVLGEVYRSYKDEISREVGICNAELMDLTRSQHEASSTKLLHLIRAAVVMLIVLVLLIILIVYCNARLIIRPIKYAIGLIRSGKEVPEAGASELRFLAQAYDRLLAQNAEQQAQLDYEATHDALTGLFNRSVFEKRRRDFTSKSTLLLIDLDHFKEVNDHYGHEVGDRALQKTAGLLTANFRESDWVCRIGGDEFAVIMVNAGSAQKALLTEKLEHVNQVLRQAEADLPALSISAGIAFGDREDPGEDVFKDADVALYRAKQNGRSRFEFHEPKTAKPSDRKEPTC